MGKSEIEGSSLSQDFQSQRDIPVGLAVECYYNSKDPSQIVLHKVYKDGYNNLVLKQVLWPLAIAMMGVVALVTAGCHFSSRYENKYERLDGISTPTSSYYRLKRLETRL